MEFVQPEYDRSYNPGVGKMQAEFVMANFGPHKLDLKIEEKLGVVPPELSKTSKMNDPPPPRNLRVKAGYTGHVPHVSMPIWRPRDCCRRRCC